MGENISESFLNASPRRKNAAMHTVTTAAEMQARFTVLLPVRKKK